MFSQCHWLQGLVVATKRRHSQTNCLRAVTALRTVAGDILQKSLNHRRWNGVPLELDTLGDHFLKGNPNNVCCGSIHQRPTAIATINGCIDCEGQPKPQRVRVLLYLHTTDDSLCHTAGITTNRVAHNSNLVENTRQLRSRSHDQRLHLLQHDVFLQCQQGQVDLMANSSHMSTELLTTVAIVRALHLQIPAVRNYVCSG
mmetsp:Transcript_90721/g.216572  ORF Transcript_90721/g.216572 Transcript_90721/m.216572 type:complete len:200 (-) Transcript_90721:13-612(-)